MSGEIRRTFVLWLCLCFIGLPVSGQTNNNLDMYKGYSLFRNITLPYDANAVYTFCQDDQGMMWIGTTKSGLFSYNGHDFHRFLNDFGPEGNSIYAITQISTKYLCVATDVGLFCFNLLTECYETPYPEWEKLGATRSIAMFDEKLWIGTRDEGLYSFDFSTRELKKEGLVGINEKLIYALEPAGDKLFIGSHDAFSIYDKKTKKRQEIDLIKGNRLVVYAILWDEKRQCVWIGTGGMLLKYDIVGGNVEQLSQMHTNYRTMTMDANGSLLVGSNTGVFAYDLTTHECLHFVHDARNYHSLCNNVVHCIMRDRSNNIWFATGQGMSCIYATSNWKVIRLPEIVTTNEGNVFISLLVDSRGDYWMGGENGLLHIKQRGKNEKVDWFKADDHTHPLNHDYIHFVYEDRDHDIWIASDGSIARYDSLSNKFNYYLLQDSIDKMISNWAYNIIEDTQGRLWVSTFMGGLFVVDKKALISNGTEKPYTKLIRHLANDDGLSDMVFRIFPDKYGKMWLRTQDGLMSVDMTTFKIEKKDIQIDQFILVDNEIYFSSQQHLYCYNILTDKMESLSFVSESTTFPFILVGKQVWFSCVDGIYYIDTSNKKIYRYGNIETRCFAGFYNKHRDELLWGGEDCIVRFSLANDVDNEGVSLPVRITAITRDGDLMLPHIDYKGDNPCYDSSIQLKHRGNISFELSSFSYRHVPDDETFYYKVNDDPWQRLERGATHLTFFDLMGGEYLISLSNTNPEEDEDAIVSTYRLYMPYPWYATTYAIVVYVLLIALIVFLSVMFFQRRNKRKYVQREKEKSLELSNMKIDFFTNISHDLKTPLSLIIAPLSKLMAETTQGSKKRVLQSIYDNAMRLNTLTHKILDFKQMEYESEDTLIRSRIELRTLVENCISNFSAIANERGISLSLSTDIDVLWIDIDQVKIESAFINIISNSIKHVKDNSGEITVTLQRSTRKAIIKVTDNGTGIAEGDLPLVFVRFFQGKDHSEGQGIGLYLTKKYVELHEGQIKLHNNSFGGLTVSISLPITEEIKDEAGATHQEEETKDKELLIIDDNKEIVDFLSEALTRQYRIATAYDGKEGLEAVEKSLPDLIIVDQMMPEMDGLEFARTVRRNYPTSAIPIIMLTARDDTDTELRSIRVGIDAFIAKPFDFNILRVRIEQLLKKRQTIEKSVRMEALSSLEFVPDEGRDPDEMLLENVTKTIEDNMSREDFNVSMLTSTIGIDSKQLYRKMKQLTGMSPVNYMKKLKMKKAAMLLSQNRFTVSEVVYMVGYTNASYFTKCFVEEYGITPKQFVAEHKDNK